ASSPTTTRELVMLCSTEIPLARVEEIGTQTPTRPLETSMRTDARVRPAPLLLLARSGCDAADSDGSAPASEIEAGDDRADLERQIERAGARVKNVTAAMAASGFSDALLAQLREEEATVGALKRRLASATRESRTRIEFGRPSEGRRYPRTGTRALYLR